MGAIQRASRSDMKAEGIAHRLVYEAIDENESS